MLPEVFNPSVAVKDVAILAIKQGRRNFSTQLSMHEAQV